MKKVTAALWFVVAALMMYILLQYTGYLQNIGTLPPEPKDYAELWQQVKQTFVIKVSFHPLMSREVMKDYMLTITLFMLAFALCGLRGMHLLEEYWAPKTIEPAINRYTYPNQNSPEFMLGWALRFTAMPTRHILPHGVPYHCDTIIEGLLKVAATTPVPSGADRVKMCGELIAELQIIKAKYAPDAEKARNLVVCLPSPQFGERGWKRPVTSLGRQLVHVKHPVVAERFKNQSPDVLACKENEFL